MCFQGCSIRRLLQVVQDASRKSANLESACSADVEGNESVCVLVGAQQDLDYRCCLIMKWKQVLAAEIVEAFATEILELVNDQEFSSWGVLKIPAAVVKQWGVLMIPAAVVKQNIAAKLLLHC